MVQLAANIWADGPVSTPTQPYKPDIRAWGTWVESIINSFTSSGGLIYTSRASLYADLVHAAFSMAWVLGDSTAAYNGVYAKLGASGAGSWVRVGDLPYSFVVASDAGAGTPNAIVATSSIPVSGSTLVWVTLANTNTAAPTTISFNGGSALTIKTNSGTDPVVGGLLAGMTVMGIVSGSTFRLVSDQASSAVMAAAAASAAAAAASATSASASATQANSLISTIGDGTSTTYTVGGAAQSIATGVAGVDKADVDLWISGSIQYPADYAIDAAGTITPVGGTWPAGGSDNALVKVKTTVHVSMPARINTAINRAALKAISGSGAGAMYLREQGREGVFQFTTDNMTSQVTSDPSEGIYIAPSSDPTGGGGAWVRQYYDTLQASWFGITLGFSTSQATAMQAFLNFLGQSSARSGIFQTGVYRLDSGIVIPPGVKLIGNGAKPVVAVASTLFDFSSAPAGTIAVDVGSAAGQVYGNALEYICVKRSINEAKGSGGVGIRVRAITGVDWQSVVVTGFDINVYMGTSATAGTVTTQVKLNNCSFLNCATMTARIDGVYEWFAYSCQFGGSYGADFALFLGAGTNGLVSNATHFSKCFFIGPAVSGGTAIGDLARITAGFWHNFDECVFEQAANCGVALYYAADENITLVNVNIKNCWTDTVNYGVRNLGAGRPNVNISGCRLSAITSPFDYNLSAAQTAISRHIVVSDNILQTPITTNNAVTIYYCRGAKILNNTIYTGGTGAAIAIDASADMTKIVNNHFIGTGGDGNGVINSGTNTFASGNTKNPT